MYLPSMLFSPWQVFFFNRKRLDGPAFWVVVCENLINTILKVLVPVTAWHQPYTAWTVSWTNKNTTILTDNPPPLPTPSVLYTQIPWFLARVTRPRYVLSHAHKHKKEKNNRQTHTHKVTSHTLTLAPNPPKVLVLTAFSEAVMSKYILVYSLLVNYCLLKNKKGKNTYTHTHTHTHTHKRTFWRVWGVSVFVSSFLVFGVPSEQN